MVTRLQVTYKSSYVDDELDKKILNFFNRLDFVCIDRAYIPIEWRRQLDFERHSKEMEEDGSKRNQKVKLTA